MSFIKEDYVLGNKKIVVGDNLHDLVLENLGKIWIRYGNSYKDFQSFISSVAKSTSDFSKVIIESTGIQDPEKYKQGSLVFDARKKILYLKYQDDLLILLEYDDKISEKYVSKTGDKMTGPLEIYYDGVPLKIKSAELVKNLNVEYLQGKTPEDFAQKKLNETITGNWTFQGNDVHNGHNDFNNSVDINGELQVTGEASFSGKSHFYNNTDFSKIATFKDNGTAIKVGTGDIVTDGSIGSSQFMSGMTGYGWRLDASTNTLTIDNLIVRGVLNVFELVVNKISATNGSLWITDSFKINTIHNIKYLSQTDYANFVASKASIDELFNKENYYIPVTNYIHTETPDKTTHPYATRDNQSPEGTDTPTFDFFDWTFRILNLEEFKSKFIPVVTTTQTETETQKVLQEYLDDLANYYGIRTYIDDNDYIRVIEVTEEDKKLDNFEYIHSLVMEHNELSEDNLYLKIEDNVLITTREIEDAIKSDRLSDEIIIRVYGEESETTPADLSISDLFTLSTLQSLAASEYIELFHVFQSDPKRANELEDIPNSSFSISPDGKSNFMTQLFTVVNSKSATLEDDGYYSFGDSAISRINLYYKYFGSNLTKGMNIHVLESEHDEYPVFKPGDILKCQKFTGTNIKQYHAIVLGLAGEYSFIVQLQNYSIIQEGTTYSYNLEGELVNTDLNVDSTLYDRSEGLTVDLNSYLSKARDILFQYGEGDESITNAQIHWAIQVLIPEDQVDSYETALLAAQTQEDILTQVNTIIQNGILGLTYEEMLEHPIFKKALEDSTNGTPEKDDALVRIGSIYAGDRRNSMYLTSSEGNSPYQDILVNINRPDYTVNYLIPKYRSFEGCFIYEGNQRKGTFYVQDLEFQYIMQIGDKLKELNKTWTASNFSNLPSSIAKTYLNSNYTITDAKMLELKAIYDQYRPYSMLSFVTDDGNDNICEGYYTINPEHLTYDINGNIIINNGLYFTLNESKVITGKQLSQNNSLEYSDNGNSVQITIGSTI